VQHKVNKARGGLSQRNYRELPDAGKLDAKKDNWSKPKMDHFIWHYFANIDEGMTAAMHVIHATRSPSLKPGDNRVMWRDDM
jgi:hypothetical protein